MDFGANKILSDNSVIVRTARVFRRTVVVDLLAEPTIRMREGVAQLLASEMKTSRGYQTRPGGGAAKIAYEDKELLLEVPSFSDHISSVLVSTGSFYELEFLSVLRRLLRPGSLVIDVGANIGNHSLFFAVVCSCRVVAYEPIASTATILERNIELNFVDGLIESRRLALGAASGNARVRSFSEENIGGTRLELDSNGSLNLQCLDAEWFESAVDFIKIDAEGMDIDVLRGGMTLIERDRPLISCEASDRASEVELSALMDSLGYACLGGFNATPTFIYAPVRELSEVTKFLQLQAQVTLWDQQMVSELRNEIARNLRYTQRLLSEHSTRGHVES